MELFFKLVLLTCLFSACQKQGASDFNALLRHSPKIEGSEKYLNTPFVTAGNRVYIVGNQDGSFPEIGWHIKKEMGGIWNHPIKLLDGFQFDLIWNDENIPLTKAKKFTNYPFANQHLFILANKNIEVERWQFVPDNKEGVVVQLIIKNNGSENQVFKLQFTGNTDLRPTWLGEKTQMINYADTANFDTKINAWVVKDSLNPWYTVFGLNEKPNEYSSKKFNYLGNGVSASTTYDISLSANETKVLNFVLAGSYTSKENAVASYTSISKNIYSDFEKKKIRYEKLASQSKLNIPDKRIQETFAWLKYNSDWLVRTVPEIGTGITAGIPDYPWWFGVDSEYALKGYMAIGQTEPVYQTIHLLDSLSTVTNGNGRIVHETSTNGVVFNKGNSNETPQFASLIWEVYQWNGDLSFLQKYYPNIRKGLAWLMAENDSNKNLFPDGFGMMEIHGMDSEMIDVAAYTQRAFDDVSKMAEELGEHSDALSYKEIANTLKNKINTEFWSDEFNSFADFIGTDEQALKLIDDAVIRADSLNKPWAVAELKKTEAFIKTNPSKDTRPFVLHHNWVVNTPMEMNIADNEKGIRALETAEKFVNPFGVFVTGIDRDESAGSDDRSFKGSKVFSYTGAVMTLPTGVQAIAENNYGRPNQSLNYLKKMSRTFSYALPGSMYEVSPDYGMITQAWNIYSFGIPIVQQFFGIHPQASKRKVLIKLQMPDEWDNASLENVIIADNSISIFYNKTKDLLNLKLVQENPTWELEIVFDKIKDNKTCRVIESSTDHKLKDQLIVFKTKATSTNIVLEYK